MTLIKWDPKSRDFLRKLPENVAKRIFRKVDSQIKPNVERYLEGLSGKDEKKIRIGSYRLIVSYYKENDLLVIRAIRHRKNAYKR